MSAPSQGAVLAVLRDIGAAYEELRKGDADAWPFLRLAAVTIMPTPGIEPPDAFVPPGDGTAGFATNPRLGASARQRRRMRAGCSPQNGARRIARSACICARMPRPQAS